MTVLLEVQRIAGVAQLGGLQQVALKHRTFRPAALPYGFEAEPVDQAECGVGRPSFEGPRLRPAENAHIRRDPELRSS